MCRRVNCSKCNKPTWAGCGAHIESVLGDVPMAQRCACREAKKATGPTEGNAGGGSFWKNLFKV